MIFYILLTASIIFISFYCKKKKLFINNHRHAHQKLANIKIPLIGGFFLIILIFFLFFKNNPFFFTICFLIYILGVLSDFKILSSPKKRFIIQLFLISLFVFANRLEVLPTRIFYIDKIFLNSFWSYMFTIFCLMILINGSNFIDGLNGLLVGYVLIILFILYKLNLFDLINLNQNQFCFLIYFVSIIFILNILNYLFLGDGGAYLLSFFIGFVLIKIYNLSSQLSPYFIILLLWYPCFENLFSIIRKKFYKKNATKPDNMHLHHLFFIFLQKNLNFNKLANPSASILINLYNFIALYLGSQNPDKTIFQILIITCSVLFYLFIYFILINKFKDKFN